MQREWPEAQTGEVAVSQAPGPQLKAFAPAPWAQAGPAHRSWSGMGAGSGTQRAKATVPSQGPQDLSLENSPCLGPALAFCSPEQPFLDCVPSQLMDGNTRGCGVRQAWSEIPVCQGQLQFTPAVLA